MKAVIYRGIGDICLEEVPEPDLVAPTDAIVRLTASAICGTDLHLVRGTLPGMRPGTILGHEGVAIVEELGEDVRNLDIGDRVVISPTIACGTCTNCRSGCYSQCDSANPNGPHAGPAYFGGPVQSGPFQGLQADLARVPHANVGLVKLPDEISDDQAILVSDIFPTGYFGADLASIHPGCTLVVFGCGPVGLFAIASAMLLDAGRVLAVDAVDSRLEMARAQGAEVVNFDEEDPVEAILRLTDDVGVDRAIDAVGIDAVGRLEVAAPHGMAHQPGRTWRPGDAPSQALTWAVQSLAKSGTLVVIGAYPPSAQIFPIGLAMNKNLTIRTGYCHHRQYIPLLLERVVSGRVDPTRILAQLEPLTSAVEAYHAFDSRQPRWVKVELRHQIHSRAP